MMWSVNTYLHGVKADVLSVSTYLHDVKADVLSVNTYLHDVKADGVEFVAVEDPSGADVVLFE